MKHEIRFLSGAELRAASDGTIRGYAAVFNSDSQNLGGFIEQVKPGAFSRAIRERQDTKALINHDSSMLLGRVKNNTLTLSEDKNGLYFVCNLPNTTVAQDVRELIRRGDISQCSFGFRAVKEAWPAVDRRELIDVDLDDVSVVTDPAYPATSVSARSLPADVSRVGRYSLIMRPPEIETVSEEELDALRLRRRFVAEL